MAYLPVQTAENFGHFVHGVFRMFQVEELRDDCSLQDIFEYLLDPTFATPQYRGKLKPLNDKVVYAGRQAKLAHDTDFIQHLYESLSMSAMLAQWKKGKPVYLFDHDFAMELANTENLHIFPSLWRHQPFPTFYLDLSNIPEFAPFLGIFVHVAVDENDCITMWLYRVNEENYYPCRDYLSEEDKHSENGVTYYEYKLDTVQKQLAETLANPPANYDGDFINDNQSSDKLTLFVLQAINYLASEKPDVCISNETRFGQRQAKKNNRKYDEPTKMEVGYRFGAAFRKAQQPSAKIVYDDEEAAAPGETHKPHRPHARRAHWHHYWVGKGRTTLIVKWVSQTFVGLGDESQAVIHTVKKEK